jgi:hypothetical protein
MPDGINMFGALLAGDVVYVLFSVFIIEIIGATPAGLRGGPLLDLGMLWGVWLVVGGILGVATVLQALDAFTGGGF